jgi:hypothetical protein
LAFYQLSVFEDLRFSAFLLAFFSISVTSNPPSIKPHSSFRSLLPVLGALRLSLFPRLQAQTNLVTPVQRLASLPKLTSSVWARQEVPCLRLRNPWQPLKT